MWDLALNPLTGDLVWTGNMDFQIVEGSDVIQQRIHNRLMIVRPWIYDPTGGTLGSRLKDALRISRDRAIIEIPLIVKEALNPMQDISVDNIEVVESSAREVLVKISYLIVDPNVEIINEPTAVIVAIPVA